MAFNKISTPAPKSSQSLFGEITQQEISKNFTQARVDDPVHGALIIFAHTLSKKPIANLTKFYHELPAANRFNRHWLTLAHALSGKTAEQLLSLHSEFNAQGIREADALVLAHVISGQTSIVLAKQALQIGGPSAGNLILIHLLSKKPLEELAKAYKHAMGGEPLANSLLVAAHAFGKKDMKELGDRYSDAMRIVNADRTIYYRGAALLLLAEALSGKTLPELKDLFAKAGTMDSNASMVLVLTYILANRR